MPLNLLQKNIEREIEIANEMIVLYNQFLRIEDSPIDSRILSDSFNHLLIQLDSLNKAIPSLLNGIKFYKDLKEKDSEKKLENITKIKYQTSEDKQFELAINKEDKSNFLKGVSKSDEIKENVEKIRKNNEIRGIMIETEKEKSTLSFLGPYIRLSNRFFLNLSDKLISNGYFDSLNKELRKISSPFILRSYVSMMLFSGTLAFFLGMIISIIFLILKMPIIGIAIFFLTPIIIAGGFYMHPFSQSSDFDKKITQELPFVVIYMASVSTSGISPINIFTILSRTRDYPATQREIKKLLNYINFYGYDLVNALRYSSKTCPSPKLAMLFNGLATATRSGGDLSEFLNKHAEGLLFDYRLEREKYTKIAETFMDIYISILIAAPMIMMILLVLLSLTKTLSSFLTPGILSISIIGIISVMNVGFLMFLNAKQPKF